MKQLINYVLFFFIGTSFHLFYDVPLYHLLSMLCAIILTSLTYLYQRALWLTWLNLAFALLCVWNESFLCYLPLLQYCVYHKKFTVIQLLYLLPIGFHVIENPSLSFILTGFCIFAMFSRHMFDENEELKQSYIRQRDDSKEMADMLSDQNQNLLIRQEQEMRIAILDERNRIAREIHDHVGHLLSSSLLQLGAIQAIQKDPALTLPLQNLKDTLSQGMDNVRSSVHDLHDDAIDLHITLQKLLADFTFCKTSLEYDVLHPLRQSMVYHILAIVKESLSNTAKHSNASSYHIILREQPAFYQLILQDNGTQTTTLDILQKGMGLSNMKERVEAMHGYLNISQQAGFQIYITLPKKEEDHENIISG